MYMMNDREFSNRKETLHGEFYENALKYPERIALKIGRASCRERV